MSVNAALFPAYAGLGPNRTSRQQDASPDYEDWDQIIAELLAHQLLLNGKINVQTGTTYTVQLSDNGGTVTLDNGSAVTVTLPDTLPVGFSCKLIQIGAGLVTVVGGGSLTIVTESAALTTNAQHGKGELEVYAVNSANWATYDVTGV